MLTLTEIQSILKAHSFEKTHETKKTLEYEHSHTGLTLYLKGPNKDGKAQRETLVVDPEMQSRVGIFRTISGVHTTVPTRYYHLSNMNRFPSRLHTGKKTTHYGLAFDFEDSKALNSFIGVLLGGITTSIIDDIESIEKQSASETEKLVLKKARIGQGKFRDDLIEEFEGKCPLTGVTEIGLLRASHIKPWSQCTNNADRLDKNNGLLLAANMDALFDQGYISFDHDGHIIISSALSAHSVAAFGLKPEFQLRTIPDSRSNFLAYHRENLLLKSPT
ncbi:HNH endonuclease [Lentibacter sp. XHP0401]|uniref:HNH endonuclease n=1 Tax=Lentibacter sp. XHP0401 TaxID=2984334 RepID=UPI0021E815E1|nr:HNH endonuclease [Lentibacter sp. XHP0401]MCV2894737.1 HNH endonuclease [Lentibacter sp. XHP0401]